VTVLSVTMLIHRIWTASRVAPAGGQRDQQQADLVDRGREQVQDHLLQVAVDQAALLDRGDDRREVVVGDHDPRRALGDLGAGDAHGHADVGARERRRVVDAVAVIATTSPRLQRLDDPQLLGGLHAREHRDPAEHALQRGLVHPVERGTVDGERALVRDAELAGDGQSRQRVVAGDHHRGGCLRRGSARPPPAPRRAAGRSGRPARAGARGRQSGSMPSAGSKRSSATRANASTRSARPAMASACARAAPTVAASWPPRRAAAPPRAHP
jgi:hypothetical protein